MNKVSFSLLIAFAAMLTLILVSSFMALQPGSLKIAKNHSIRFTSNNPSGVFSLIKGDIIFDANKLPESKFNVEIDANSINTGNGLKNRHAKGDGWFDVKKYPRIKFSSTQIIKSSTGYIAIGILDMHGVQKQISIPFTYEDNVFEGSFNVNRLDYKIGTLEGNASKASIDIKVEIMVPVIL